jgi:hypothetical protein
MLRQTTVGMSCLPALVRLGTLLGGLQGLNSFQPRWGAAARGQRWEKKRCFPEPSCPKDFEPRHRGSRDSPSVHVDSPSYSVPVLYLC